MFSLPGITMSLVRPTMLQYPSASMTPRSRVCIQFSLSTASAVLTAMNIVGTPCKAVCLGEALVEDVPVRERVAPFGAPVAPELCLTMSPLPLMRSQM